MLLENISTLLGIEDFWILLGMMIGSLMMSFFAFLYAITEIQEVSFESMGLISKTAFFLSILAGIICLLVFVFTFIVLFALAGAVSTVGLPI